MNSVTESGKIYRSQFVTQLKPVVFELCYKESIFNYIPTSII
jgi:hypothetical protein